MIKDNECAFEECDEQRNQSNICFGGQFALYVYTVNQLEEGRKLTIYCSLNLSLSSISIFLISLIIIMFIYFNVLSSFFLGWHINTNDVYADVTSVNVCY